MKCTIALLALLVAAASGSAQTRRSADARAETYASADIDADGNLRIVTSDQRTIVVSKTDHLTTGSDDQTSFSTPVISPNRRAVAAQALFGNCCTSYDIPLQLVVYSGGREHRFEGGLAIFDWHFDASGTRIAFGQQPVHFGCFVHWELRDVATERRLAEVDIPEACGEIPNPPTVKVPAWVNGTTPP